MCVAPFVHTCVRPQLSTENSDLKQSVASAASFEENNRTLESSMLSLQQIKSELAVQLVEEKATSQQLRQQLSQPQPSPPPASSPPASSPPSLPQTPASKAVQSASESESHELQLLKEMRDQEREEELSSREKKLEEERDRSSSEMSSLKAKLVQSQRAAQNASVETSRKEQEIADLKQKLTQLTTESAQNDSAAELTQLREALAAEKETSVMRLTRVQNESSIGIKKASDDTARSLQENTQLHEVIKNMKMAMSRSSDDSATYEKMYTDLQQEYVPHDRSECTSEASVKDIVGWTAWQEYGEKRSKRPARIDRLQNAGSRLKTPAPSSKRPLPDGCLLLVGRLLLAERLLLAGR